MNKSITYTDENTILRTQLINVASGIPGERTFTNCKPGNVFFNRLQTTSRIFITDLVCTKLPLLL